MKTVAPSETLSTVPSRSKAKGNGKSKLPAPVTSSPLGGIDYDAILRQAFRLADKGETKGGPFKKAMLDVKALLGLTAKESLPVEHLESLRSAEKSIAKNAFLADLETNERFSRKTSGILRGKGDDMSYEERVVWTSFRKMSPREQIQEAARRAEEYKTKVKNTCALEMPGEEEKVQSVVKRAVRFKETAIRFATFAYGKNAAIGAGMFKGKFVCRLSGWVLTTHEKNISDAKKAEADAKAREAAQAESKKSQAALAGAKERAKSKGTVGNSGQQPLVGETGIPTTGEQVPA